MVITKIKQHFLAFIKKWIDSKIFLTTVASISCMPFVVKTINECLSIVLGWQKMY